AGGRHWDRNGTIVTSAAGGVASMAPGWPSSTGDTPAPDASAGFSEPLPRRAISVSAAGSVTRATNRQLPTPTSSTSPRLARPRCDATSRLPNPTIDVSDVISTPLIVLADIR